MPQTERAASIRRARQACVAHRPPTVSTCPALVYRVHRRRRWSRAACVPAASRCGETQHPFVASTASRITPTACRQPRSVERVQRRVYTRRGEERARVANRRSILSHRPNELCDAPSRALTPGKSADAYTRTSCQSSAPVARLAQSLAQHGLHGSLRIAGRQQLRSVRRRGLDGPGTRRRAAHRPPVYAECDEPAAERGHPCGIARLVSRLTAADAIDVYFPSRCISEEALEKFDSVAAGKARRIIEYAAR